MAEDNAAQATTTAPQEKDTITAGEAGVPEGSASEPTATDAAGGEVKAPATDADASARPVAAPTPPANVSSDSKGMVTIVNGVPAASDARTEAAPAAETNGTNGTANKKEKRKSNAGIPEHKNKKLNRKKSTMDLHLNAQPGEYWYVTMKGYKPWPSIICDEEMLPESLLSKRPVSAMRPDGTYREDFMEGGKNARDRRYPVMFLGTNEFAWQVNTELQPLDVDEVKRVVENNESTGKTKALWEAFKVAAESNDLQYFKNMLVEHEQRMIKERQEQAEKEQKQAEETEKKTKKKAVVVADVDVEMEDVGSEEAPKKPKKSNKRKAPKEGESDGDDKPTKTPKKIKIKAPVEPTEEAAPKPKKASKPKKPKVDADSEVAAKPARSVEPVLTPEERLEKKQKTILFLRHKLQKGFLSRDQTPKAEEMPQMSEHLAQLEQHTDLEGSIIRATKINKVLKAMLKLTTIPQEETFNFKKRSGDLLAKWASALTSAEEAATASAVEPATNGVAHEETPAEAPAKTEPADVLAKPKVDLGDDAKDDASDDKADASTAKPASAEAIAT